MASSTRLTNNANLAKSRSSDQVCDPQYEDSRELVEEESPSNDESEATVTKSRPMQKRRRVTRACDECRRKKIRCDGKHPCLHCMMYDYECSYNQPSNRRRTCSPQYIEFLENQLEVATDLLHVFFPGMDLNGPGMMHHLRSRVQDQASTPELRPSGLSASSHAIQCPGNPPVEETSATHWEVMGETSSLFQVGEERTAHNHDQLSHSSFLRNRWAYDDMIPTSSNSSPSPSLSHTIGYPDSPSLNTPKSPCGLPLLSVARRDMTNLPQAPSSGSLTSFGATSTNNIHQKFTPSPVSLVGPMLDSSRVNIPSPDISTLMPTSSDALVHSNNPTAMFETNGWRASNENSEPSFVPEMVRPTPSIKSGSYPTSLAPAEPHVILALSSEYRSA